MPLPFFIEASLFFLLSDPSSGYDNWIDLTLQAWTVSKTGKKRHINLCIEIHPLFWNGKWSSLWKRLCYPHSGTREQNILILHPFLLGNNDESCIFHQVWNVCSMVFPFVPPTIWKAWRDNTSSFSFAKKVWSRLRLLSWLKDWRCWSQDRRKQVCSLPEYWRKAVTWRHVSNSQLFQKEIRATLPWIAFAFLESFSHSEHVHPVTA